MVGVVVEEGNPAPVSAVFQAAFESTESLQPLSDLGGGGSLGCSQGRGSHGVGHLVATGHLQLHFAQVGPLGADREAVAAGWTVQVVRVPVGIALQPESLDRAVCGGGRAAAWSTVVRDQEQTRLGKRGGQGGEARSSCSGER